MAEKAKLLSGWLPSVVERMEEVGDKYFVYRDIVGPFLAGMQQVSIFPDRSHVPNGFCFSAVCRSFAPWKC